jgi:hypothetical protein
MSRVPPFFHQSDVTRALKGVRAAGHEPKAVKITITIEVPIAGDQDAENRTTLDEWRQRHAR